MEFSGKRLGFLLNKLIEEGKREFLIVALVFLITGVFATQLEIGETILIMAVMIGYFVSVCENSFSWYKRQNKRINSLLLPASAFEKYIAIFILTLVAPAVMIFLFGMASVCFYGSLFFKKVTFPNLIGYAGLSLIAFNWIKEYISHAYMPDWNSPYRESFIDAYRDVMDCFGIGLNLVIFVGFMVLTYLRLKEERS